MGAGTLPQGDVRGGGPARYGTLKYPAIVHERLVINSEALCEHGAS